MKISKTNVNILSWIDIVFGAVFFMLGIMGGLLLLAEPAILPLTSIDAALTIFIGLVMIVSGVFLIELKMQKYSVLTGWLTSIFGLMALFSLVIVLIQGAEYTTASMAISLIIGQTSYLLMIISGYYLRKFL